jgi:hypothetical protein
MGPIRGSFWRICQLSGASLSASCDDTDICQSHGAEIFGIGLTHSSRIFILSFRATRTGMAWRGVPPAAVFVRFCPFSRVLDALVFPSSQNRHFTFHIIFIFDNDLIYIYYLVS